jgi:hypothetical protein
MTLCAVSLHLLNHIIVITFHLIVPVMGQLLFNYLLKSHYVTSFPNII